MCLVNNGHVKIRKFQSTWSAEMRGLLAIFLFLYHTIQRIQMINVKAIFQIKDYKSVGQCWSCLPSYMAVSKIVETY